MIKIIGVMTDSGIPISILNLINIENEEFIASLISVVNALSEVIGEDSIKRVDFGRDKLLIKDTKKGYIIFALVTRAEKFIERLLIVIARDIDSAEDIESAGGFVDDILCKKIGRILNRYIEPNIPIGIADIIITMWKPLLESIMRDPRLGLGIRRIRRKIGESLENERKSWEKFMKKIRKTKREASAIEYALNGDFEYAYVFSRNSDNPIEQIFCLKVGILSRSILNKASPPLEELERVGETLPKENIYAKLVRTELEYIKGATTIANLIGIYRKAINNFKFEDDEESLMLAFLFVSPFVGMLGGFGWKLAEFFKDKSDLIYSYLVALCERQRILGIAHSITSYDEIRRDLLTWEEKAEEYLVKLSSALGSSRETKPNNAFLTFMPNITTYQTFLKTLMDAPILTLNEKVSFAFLNLDIYHRYIRRSLKEKIPIFINDSVDSFQATSKALEILYPISTKDRLVEDFVERSRELLQDIIDVSVNNMSKFRPYLEYILATMSNIMTNFVELNIRMPEELEVAYLVINELSVVNVESWKYIQPYQLMKFSADLMNIIISMSIRYLRGNVKADVVLRGVHNLMRTYKWFLTHGRVYRESIYYIATYLRAVHDLLDKKELYEILDLIEGFTYILVPDIKQEEEEVAMISEPLLRLIKLVCKKFDSKKYLELSDKILSATISTFKRRGLVKKSKEIVEEFKKEDKRGVLEDTE